MYYEKDFLIRQIRAAIRGLAALIFGRNTDETELEQHITEYIAEPLIDELVRLLSAGLINEAENRLYDEIEIKRDAHTLKTALWFYSALNNMSDEALERADFSRGEIEEGLASLKRIYTNI